MDYIDASKSDLELLVLNEKTWQEFWDVALPHHMPKGGRQRAERRIERAGFKSHYRFLKRLTDAKSASLAKAQAASVVRRIKDRTGIKMEMVHGLMATG